MRRTYDVTAFDKNDGVIIKLVYQKHIGHKRVKGTSPNLELVSLFLIVVAASFFSESSVTQ